MIDTLLKNRAKAQRSIILDKLALNGHKYALLTLHRPVNVDDQQVLRHILDVIGFILKEMPVIFPVHPRTRKNLYSAALGKRVDNMAAGSSKAGSQLRLMEPLGYLDFLRLMTSAAVVLTDSGGIQEETTILKVPCLTLRENTERPATVKYGFNRVVGTDPQRIIAAYKETVDSKSRRFLTPPLWDGQAARRIVDVLTNKA